jgi:hypothetical protein
VIDAGAQHEQSQIGAGDRHLARLIVDGNGPIFLIDAAVLDVEITPSVTELR